MDAPAQHIAIMPLQRVGAGKAMIAGQRQRVLDRRDRIVGDRQLDDVGFGRAQQNAVVEIAGKTIDQARIDGQPRLDRADDFLRARQRRQRCTEIGRHALFQELDQPVARGARDAVIDRRDEDRMGRRLGEIRHPPVLRLADIDLVIERKHDVVEDHVMAAAGAQAQMIPGLDDPRARQSRRNQKQPDPHAPARRSWPRPHTISGSAHRSNRSCGR